VCFAAFAPAGRVGVSQVRMSVFQENLSGLSSGEVAPTGYFDPLGLATGKDAATIKQWRQAELKHGRVCMLAAVGLLTQEIGSVVPGSALDLDGPAIFHLDLLDEKFPEFGEIVIHFLFLLNLFSHRKLNFMNVGSLSFFVHSLKAGKSLHSGSLALKPRT